MSVLINTRSSVMNDKEKIVHLTHEIERIHGRMRHLYADWAELLDTGVSALCKSDRGREVMLDRATWVLDKLRAEMAALNVN